MLQFNRIYFDANPLIAAEWPRLSAKLEEVLQLAQIFRVALLLPQAVELELEEHWLREFDKKHDEVVSRMEKLEKHTANVVTDRATLPLLDRNRVRSEYRAKVQALKEKWAIETVPLTSRSLDEVFRMSVRRDPPFREEGKGFQDAVILLSVIDHLRDASGQVGAFISQNTDFKGPEAIKLAISVGVQIRLYKTVDEILHVLVGQLQEVVRSNWEQEKQHVAEILNTMLPQIKRFIAENLEIPEWGLGLIGKLVAVPQIDVACIKSVQVPLPFGQEASQPIRRISFETEVNLYIVMERFPLPTPRVVKVGEEILPPSLEFLKALAEGPQEPKREEHVLQRAVEVEATATIMNNEYRDIQFVSARLK